jgi:hypothetical protein
MADATPSPPAGLESGVLTFDRTGEAIGPAITCRDFAESKEAKSGTLHLASGRSIFELKNCTIAGARFHARIEYHWETIHRIDLMMTRSSDGTSWSDWNYENEMARKRSHESWSAALIGRPLELKPYLMPEPVIPYNAGEDHPRHAVFPWGELLSYYDSKGGGSYLALCYGVKPAPDA